VAHPFAILKYHIFGHRRIFYAVVNERKRRSAWSSSPSSTQTAWWTFSAKPQLATPRAPAWTALGCFRQKPMSMNTKCFYRHTILPRVQRKG